MSSNTNIAMATVLGKRVIFEYSSDLTLAEAIEMITRDMASGAKDHGECNASE